MYFRLTAYVKRRFIQELRTYWATHPRYPDLVNNIQGKYSFRERPSHGIIVKTGGGSRVDWSADNYVGVIESYVYTAKVKNYSGLSCEWVREDAVAIQNNGGVFPSPAGVYFIELTEDEEFYVDPLYDVAGEVLTPLDGVHVTTTKPFLAGTLRLFEMPAAYQLYEGDDGNYTVEIGDDGKPTGSIVLKQPLTGGRWLAADYRWVGKTTGPHRLYPGRADNRVIAGCVIAFGRRNQKGDRFAVVVQDLRRPAYLEFGGQWDLSLDFDVMARDVDAQQEISDQTIVYLWGILRPYLSSEGLEITDLSMGGESEEVYDENGDDYYYNASFSLTVSTQWSVHVPLGAYLRSVAPMTVAQAKVAAGLSDEDVAKQQNDLRQLEALGLDTMVDPFFNGRNDTYEMVK